MHARASLSGTCVRAVTPSCTRAGAQVDMDPARLTLGDLLSVHLEQRTDAVALVCAAALKELTIEAELRKIAEAWRGQRFTLHRYMRAAADERSWLLKGARRMLWTAHAHNERDGMQKVLSPKATSLCAT